MLLPHYCFLLQMEILVFVTVMMLLDEQLRIHPDSATILRERAFEIILSADRVVRDLPEHQLSLVSTCRDMLGALSKCTLHFLAKNY
jgi:hypothetical protein